MFSIPIPENERHTVRTRFEDLGSQGDLALPKGFVTSTREPMMFTGPAHLDPDIRPSLRPSFALEDCAETYLYGQDNASQTHLDNEGVGIGDLFLFFGLFRDATSVSGYVRFVRAATMQHVIWGWLQVGGKHPLHGSSVPDELRKAGHHPHLDCRNRLNNCMYVGATSLSFAPSLRGAGIFETFQPQLKLTSPGEARCSYWSLPSFFARAGMTFHNLQSWKAENGRIIGQSVGRGQEFVLRTDGVEAEAMDWLKSIFEAADRVN
jgi:hypothetical protein